MSLTNILQPNDFDLYCNSITQQAEFTASKWTNQLVFMGSSQTIPNAVNTIVNWNSSSPLPAQMPPLPYTSTNGVFTINRLCYLQVSIQIKWAGNDTGVRMVRVRRNDDAYALIQGVNIAQVLNSSPSFNTLTISWTCFLDKTGTFWVEVYQNSTGNLDIEGRIVSPSAFSNMTINTIY